MAAKKPRLLCVPAATVWKAYGIQVRRLGMILSAMRGLHICVPRDMTQAAGMYNTLLRGDEPALVIECLNGYRLKEKLPANVGEFTVPLGKAEILKEGTDITVVSYGSTLRIVMEAAEELEKMGINIEVIDPQTLYPFDTDNYVVASLKKTNKLLVVDEDVPGGASAYITAKDFGKAEWLLRSWMHSPKRFAPKNTARLMAQMAIILANHRLMILLKLVYAMMSEANPGKYPSIY